MATATRTRPRRYNAGHDATPEPGMGRRIRLWERKETSRIGRLRQHWEPITFHQMLAGLGGEYNRTTARAIEAMVAGQTVTGLGCFAYRFRPA